MDIATLMHQLTIEGFRIPRGGCIPDADALEVTGPMHRMTPTLRAAIAQHKPTLLAMLQPQVDAHVADERQAIVDADGDAPATAEALADVSRWFSCRTHLDRADWVDAPHETRPGWITTTCRICGQFIGHRPSEEKRESQKQKQSRNIEQAAEGACDAPSSPNDILKV